MWCTGLYWFKNAFLPIVALKNGSLVTVNTGVYFWLCRVLLDVFLCDNYIFPLIIQWLPILTNTKTHSPIVVM